MRSIFEPLSVCGAEYVTENNTARSRAFFKEYQNNTALPWTSWRGPELWETRLQDYWRLRGVNVTKAYLKVCIPHSGMPIRQQLSQDEARAAAAADCGLVHYRVRLSQAECPDIAE